jgi:3-phenylpropionate/cinnamic acid dioxygenase small subunit
MDAFVTDVGLEERAAVLDLLAAEAAAVDSRDWDTWLSLFAEDVDYWVPSWDSEYELTSDPQAEISLMYYGNRSGLEDRVFRIRTERSAASVPMPRTCHMVSNVQIKREPSGYAVQANWTASSFRNMQSVTYYGRYYYKLRGEGKNLIIAAKKIVVMNDLIDTSLDIYNI